MEERMNVGKPTISKLISILEDLQDEYGDVYVSGAYDGGWDDDVEIQFFEDHLIIGSIS